MRVFHSRGSTWPDPSGAAGFEHLAAQRGVVEPALQQRVGVGAALFEAHGGGAEEVGGVDHHRGPAPRAQRRRDLGGQLARPRGRRAVEDQPHAAGPGGDERDDLLGERGPAGGGDEHPTDAAAPGRTPLNRGIRAYWR